MKGSLFALVAIAATSLFAAEPQLLRSSATRRETPRGTRGTPRNRGTASVAPACVDGALGNAAPQAFDALHPEEVDSIVMAAASSIGLGPKTIAVVDRTGVPLAIWREGGANPANDDLAVGVARTAAFFSHNQAPLSSRTVRFISGIHFPPGVTNAPNAALYGIENTNRGCSFNATFNPGKAIAPATSVSGGAGPGIVTGKIQPNDSDPNAVNAGGIPLYRIIPPGLDNVTRGEIGNGHIVGGVGVVGISGDPQLAEFASATGAFGALGSSYGPIAPVPFYPLPFPGNVFIDGVRLPFLGPDISLTFDSNGLPHGVQLSDLLRPAPQVIGSYVLAPATGGCAPNGYLVGPNGGTISAADVDAIVQRAVAQAKKTRGLIRLPLDSYARMVIAVADLDGTLLALYRMPDATIFSIDVAVAKSRNVIWFSTNTSDLPGIPAGTAVTNRTIGFGAQPLYPPGIDSNAFNVRSGPFFQLFVKDLANPCTQGSQPANPNQNGIVFFPGASPLYANGKLVGGLGVSGDGVEQDDYVTVAGAGPLLPSESIWADRIKVDDVRLPMFKYPRHPEGVTECGGGPCS